MASFRFCSYRQLLLGWFLGTSLVFAQVVPPTNSISADAGSATVANRVKDLLHTANIHLENGELVPAMSFIDSALELDPQNAEAYETRAGLYVRQKLWERAEDDYARALKIAPNVSAYKYQVAEVKYLQKQFDRARALFSVLIGDESLGDLAAFKVFMCDLFSGHQARALTELAEFNKNQANPSYYFANAAWDGFHGRRKDELAMFNVAVQTFGTGRCDAYIASLGVKNLKFPVASFITRQGEQYNQARVLLEDDGLRVGTTNGWITIPLDQLPDDLSAFPDEMRKQIQAKRGRVGGVAPDKNVVSFTTKNGKKYEGVSVFLKDNGLYFLTPDGWITVSYSELPDDIPGFSEEMQKSIKEKREHLDPGSATTFSVSFTTKNGKNYEGTNVQVKDDGLHLLTDNGWLTVPFDSLPEGMAGFPQALREKIETMRREPRPETDQKLVTFTAKDGKTYDQDRISVHDDGLAVLSPDGWIIVPFNQLPDNLQGFPEEVKKDIVAKRMQAPKVDAGPTRVSFTTKDGKKYDNAKVSIDEEGLRTQTSDGWILVTFDQLPDDLSSFPADMLKQISDNRTHAHKAPAGPARITFTTKDNKKYDDVRTSLTEDGLRSLTEKGWITVSFDQLPDDLSCFPAQWRSTITTQKEALLKKKKDAAPIKAPPIDKPPAKS